MDVEHIDSFESLSFKLFILERVLFGDVTNLTPITGRRTGSRSDLYQTSQVHCHTFKGLRLRDVLEFSTKNSSDNADVTGLQIFECALKYYHELY